MPLNLESVTKDLVITDGTFTEVSGIEAVAQRVRARLFTIVNEWFLDTEFGVNQSDILGVKNPNMFAVTQIYKAEARKSLNGEAFLTSLTATFDNATRKVSVAMILTDAAGLEVADNFLI